MFDVQVPLGIIPKSEQKYEEMLDVLDHLHQYVPTVSTRKTIIDDDETIEVTCNHFHPILFGEFIAYICIFN